MMLPRVLRSTRITYLPPTVIPAQPGYFMVGFDMPIRDGVMDEVTESTKPEDLNPFYEPVIAWVVQPGVTPQGRIGDLTEDAHVMPVGVEGTLPTNAAYLVDPRGGWMRLQACSFDGEQGARLDWIKRALQRQREGTARS